MNRQVLSKKTKQIYNILTNQTLFSKPILNENIFNTDLVIKMQLPIGVENKMADKSKFKNLDEFICNPDRNLIEAHQMAYKRILQQKQSSESWMNQQSNKNQKNLLIRNQVNFQKISNSQESSEESVIEKQYRVILNNDKQSDVIFPCYFQCKSNNVDIFTLNYNSLLYVLQAKCGFQTKSILIEQENKDKQKVYFIYILLTQSTHNLLKSADKFKIKKEIDYSQIDLFLNQPVDSRGRPYQNNSCIHDPQVKKKVLRKIDQIVKKQNPPQFDIKLKKQQKKNDKYQDLKQNSFDLHNHQNDIKQLYKRVHRNMKNKMFKLNEYVIDEKEMKQKQKQKLINYLSEFFSNFDQIIQGSINLSFQQKKYIYDVNRQKINVKCQNQYILKLKRKQFFYLIKSLANKYNHKGYQTPICYFPFSLPSKKLSFMERLRGVLLYEEYKISPSGDLSLFFKMDRIKLAYLNLRQFIRVSNLQCIGCQVFALHDDYERYGIPSAPIYEKKVEKSMKGGMNGLNVLETWNSMTPWKIKLPTLRNYLGEDSAYQVYLKTHLILYFLIIAPLGILGEIVSRLFVYYNANYARYLDRGFSSTHKQQLIFHLVFFAIAIGIYAYFLQVWLRKEQTFQENFVQNQTQVAFRYQYKGPYIRNKITDSVNQYDLNASNFSVLMKGLGLFVILAILGAQCGFFHGMRMAIIKLSILMSQTNVYLISWPHIICYGIFFVVNYFLYRFGISKLTRLLTNYENLPVDNLYQDSMHAKNSLFLIGVQLIPVTFFFIFQPFGHNSCYSSSCYDQLTQYVYSRYVIVFIFLTIKLFNFIYHFLRDQMKQSINNQHSQQIVNFDQKLSKYLKFVEDQSKKTEHVSTIDDQTQALLHYGIFVSIFPLSPLLSLSNMILEYSVERLQFLVHNRRPIPKSQAIQNYSDNYKLIMHLSIFANCWMIFFTLEEIQYSFQKLISIFVGVNPTYESILILKILIIIIVIIIYEIQVAIIRFLVKQSEEKIINNRKKLKYEKHLISKTSAHKTKASLEVNKIHPFRTIFRTYHREVIEKSKRSKHLMTESQQIYDEQASAHCFKGKKN